MKFNETKLKGCFEIESDIFYDNRGYFFVPYELKEINSKLGIRSFIQINQSKSKKGTIRGLHFQKFPYQQAKLVRVINGSIIDVAVDLRKDSETYLQHIKVKLDSTNNKQLFIPRGFAHGFLALEDDTIVEYQVDNSYSQKHDTGILFCDADLNIDWEIPYSDTTISDKDLMLPGLGEINE